jgi:hypothetical protein
MPPIELCPHRDLYYQSFGGCETIRYPVSNRILCNAIERREQELRSLDLTRDTQHHVSLLSPDVLPFALSISLYSSIPAQEDCPPALVPLNQCILAIGWEFHDRSSAPNILDILDNKPLDSLITLLRFAAIHQAKLESVGGIYASVILADLSSRIN